LVAHLFFAGWFVLKCPREKMDWPLRTVKERPKGKWSEGKRIMMMDDIKG